MYRYQSRNRSPLLTTVLLYLSLFISFYLIYDWFITRKQYQCQQQIQGFNYQSFDNYGQFLQKQIDELKDPLEVTDLINFKQAISKIDTIDWQNNLKKFETSMGLLLKQLDGVEDRFISTLGLRNNINKQIELYNLCRHKIRGQNRQVSQKCQNLLVERNKYKDSLNVLQNQIKSRENKKNQLIQNEDKKKQELLDLQANYKKLQEELELNQLNANQQLQRLQFQMQAKRNSQLLALKNQEEGIDELLYKSKSDKQTAEQELKRTKSKMQTLIASRQILKQKLQSLELKSNYDHELQKLLPSRQSITKAMQLQKLLERKFNINIKILANKKGTTGYDEQKIQVEKLKAQFKQIKLFLSKVNQTILSFDINFKRQQATSKSQLQSIVIELQTSISSQKIIQAKIKKFQQQIESFQLKKTTLRSQIAELKQVKVIRNEQIEIKLKQKKEDLTTKISTFKILIEKAEGQLKNIQIEKDSQLRQWQQYFSKYSKQSTEIVKKTKEIQNQLQKNLKLLNSNLSQCKNRRKFIESIQQRAAAYLKEADQYYKEIQQTKNNLGIIISKLYLNL